MKEYCVDCEYAEKCEYAYCINFCDECKDRLTCGIRYESCDAGYDIECNNGFEPINDYDEWDDDEEEDTPTKSFLKCSATTHAFCPCTVRPKKEQNYKDP